MARESCRHETLKSFIEPDQFRAAVENRFRRDVVFYPGDSSRRLPGGGMHGGDIDEMPQGVGGRLAITIISARQPYRQPPIKELRHGFWQAGIRIAHRDEVIEKLFALYLRAGITENF
jgi:hypothetical protein